MDKKVKIVIHMADIHLRTFRMHEEYGEVFKMITEFRGTHFDFARKFALQGIEIGEDEFKAIFDIRA
jgi:hypothetical protein